MSNLKRINAPTYDPEAVQPMRNEMLANGFEELLTPEYVDKVLNRKGTTLLFINSVCGCSAGSARPGTNLALQHSTIPDHLVTLFAGQEKEAVEYLRQKHLFNFMPSLPFVALFKDGRASYALQRFEIEGAYPSEIAKRLKLEFDQNCSKKGPSISPEEFKKAEKFRTCGSKIPLLNQN